MQDCNVHMSIFIESTAYWSLGRHVVVPDLLWGNAGVTQSMEDIENC